MNRNMILRTLLGLGLVVGVAVVGFVLYLLLTEQFIGALVSVRDVIVLVYMFLARVGIPIILIVGIGGWLQRKLSPEAPGERRPLEERLPILKRLPKLSTSGILWVTFIAVLWTAFIGVVISRFLFGLSYMTNMNDTYPWGLWLGFDMISGVALSAGGFIMAGTVYVFNVKRFHPIVRPAILTAFLGYLLAIIGLLFDLGRWYDVWHAIIMWNLHSPLIEVAWCVMLYTTVLALEFSPIVFERFNLKWPLKIVRAITMPLVIIGICLSTLHQSTLGTLFLLFPEKMNPLWYSPYLTLFFFTSAIACGCAMIIIESNLSARFLGQQLERDLLMGLGKAASLILLFYFVIKAFDLITRGATAYLTAPGLHSTLYWIEMFFGVIVPMVILATKRGRENPRTLLASAILVVGGVVLNRLNTTVFSWWQYTSGGPIYLPTLAEVTVTVGLISIGVVAFGLIAKNFPVFEEAHPVHAPAE